MMDSYSDPADPDFKIELGDRIVAYDGKMVLNYSDYAMFRSMDKDYISEITIKKADGTKKVCRFDRQSEDGSRPLGMNFEYVREFHLFKTLGNSFKYLISLVRMIYYSLYWLITGTVGLNAVTGPVGITTIVGAVITAEATVATKILTLLNMTALISVNLGVFNLIPFPGLDGGQLALVGVEALRGGKKLPPEKQGLISLIGLAVMIILGIVVMGNDIWRIIQG